MTNFPDLMTPSLPQNDPDPDQRAACLAVNRSIYQFDTSYADIGFVRHVPLWDQFSPEYLAKATLLQGTVKANQVAANVKRFQTSAFGDWRLDIKTELEHLRNRALKAQWGEKRAPRVPSYTERSPLPVDAYEQIFQLIEPPANRYRWQQDWDFAWQRLAGTAPVLIQAVKETLPDNFPVTETHMQRATNGADSLAAALAEGRLFLVDFSILDGIAAGVTDHLRKYLYAPMVLLYWNQKKTAADSPTGRLMPVAIQCGQRPGPTTPIFTPADGVSWEMAKLVVQSADSNYHGIVEHGGRCHIVAAWIALFTFRHLAPSHPLRILLTPHFQFTLPLNELTRDLFLPGGRTPRLQSVSVESALKLLKRGLDEYDWNAVAPPIDFSRRGVLSPDVLPVYPYRDDALPQWAAIRKFVGDYVDLYYKSDADVVTDSELQSWFQAMGNGEEGAQIRNMGREGQLVTREDVADLVAQIIFHVTVFHALINYTVFPSMGFVPNMPTALYGPAPTAADHVPSDLLALLPPLEVGFETLSDVYVVGHLRCNTFGHYADCEFQDRRVMPLVASLQSRLEQIEHDIQVANRTRLALFEILLPSHVPQSIHI